MAERKSTRSRSSSRSSEADEKRREAESLTAEQKLVSLLDNPAKPDEASPLRGAAYFAVIVGGALVLNLALMVAISGGR